MESVPQPAIHAGSNMPRGPRGEHKPDDPVEAAIMVARTAVGGLEGASVEANPPNKCMDKANDESTKNPVDPSSTQ